MLVKVLIIIIFENIFIFIFQQFYNLASSLFRDIYK